MKHDNPKEQPLISTDAGFRQAPVLKKARHCQSAHVAKAHVVIDDDWGEKVRKYQMSGASIDVAAAPNTEVNEVLLQHPGTRGANGV